MDLLTGPTGETWWRYATAREQGHVETQLLYLDQLVDEIVETTRVAEGIVVTRDEAREYLRELERDLLSSVAR